MANHLDIRPLTVLVTDGTYKHALGIVRSLGRRGHRVYVTGTSRFAPAFYSRFASGSARCPDPLNATDRYTEQLLDLLDRWNVELIIPVGFSSVQVCARNAEDIAMAGVQMTVPTDDQFTHASDKWQMIETVRSLGIATPASCLPMSMDEAHGFRQQHVTCVAKWRHESQGKGAMLVDSAGALDEVFGTRAAERFGSIILQEFVPGHGSGYMALASDGTIVRQFAHRRVREMPASGGFATAAESIRDETVWQQGRCIMESLNWNGPGMVEFRIDGDRRWFIEFNPKFWGSLDLALACGADFPGDLVLLANGEDLTRRLLPTYRAGVRAWWPWRGDVRRLWQRPGDIGQLLGDLLSPKARSNWRWTDVIPNLLEVAGDLTSSWRHSR